MSATPDRLAMPASSQPWRTPPVDRVGGFGRSTLVEIVRPANDGASNEFASIFDADTFALTLTGRSHVAYERYAGTMAGSCVTSPGQAIACPKGLDVVSASTFDDMSLLAVRVDLATMSEHVEAQIVMPDFRPAARRTASADLLQIGRRLARELQCEDRMRALAIDALSLELVVGMIRHFDREESRADRGGMGGLSAWQIARVRDLMNANLATDIGLVAVAQATGLSAFHFARQFKRSIGMSPHRYLVELRIEQARHLILNTDLPITDIAGAVGYDDPGYFARLFRKAVGTTPAAYRRDRRA